MVPQVWEPVAMTLKIAVSEISQSPRLFAVVNILLHGVSKPVNQSSTLCLSTDGSHPSFPAQD